MNIQENLNRLIKTRDAAAAKREAIINTVEAEGRDMLNEAETTQFRRYTGHIKELDELIVEQRVEVERSGVLDARVMAVRKASAMPGGSSLPGNGDAGGPAAHPVAPLAFDSDELRQLHAAVQRRETMQIRAFASADSLLPPQLWPVVLGPSHENRLLAQLPTVATEAPSVEFIRHTGTTGVPTVVAEGQPKPEVVMAVDRVILVCQKIAAHTGVSWESINDWATFTSYVQTELMAQVTDVENAELLSGDGTAGHLTGLLSTSGILTHATGADTALDAVEQAIAKLRVGPALATADLFVVHPTTWSTIRRSKDSQDRYLTQPDPTAGEASSVWGVNALVTTQIAAGTAVLLDTRKFGRVHVREPLTLRTGYSGDDFTRNIVRFVCEERLALAVERPGAVLKLTGLPA